MSENDSPPAGNAKTAPSAESPASFARASLSPRAFWLLLMALCGLALLLRLAILDEFVRENPIAERPWADAWVYWQAAGRMADGQWTDGRVFLFAPLYPYLLGVIRTAGGVLLSVYAIQLLVHLLTAALLGWATRLRFGRTAGLLAAALFLALTEPATSTARVLASTLQVFLTVLLWWRWVVLEQHGRRWRDVVLVGALIGIFALSYPAGLLLIPAYGVWLWVASRQWLRSLPQALVGVASAFVLILPATIHNVAVGGELVLISANGGVNLRLGNGPDSKGIGGTIPGVRPKRELMFDDAAGVFEQAHGRPGSWSEIDRYFRGEAFRYWREEPLAALKNVGLKFYRFLAARNYDEITPLPIERELGLADRAILAPLATPWLLGAALVGLLAVLRHPVRYAPEWLLALLPLLVVLLFFYTARYRLPAVPIACALAAYAITRCREFKMPTAVSIAVFLLPLPLYLVNVFTGFDTVAPRRTHFVRAFSEAQVMVGEQRLATERYREAEQRFRAALELWDGNFLAHLRLGCLQAKRQQLDEAVQTLNEAIQLKPDYVPTYLYLYNALCVQQRYTEADATLKRAAALAPRLAQVRLALAWLLATCPDDAVRDGEAALHNARAAEQLATVPRYDVLDVLAAAHAELGRFEDALSAGREAAALAARQGHDRQAAEIEQRVASYRRGQPCRAAPRLLRQPIEPWQSVEKR